MADIQFLIDKSLPLAEKLLKEYGEYYPFAFALNIDNSIVGVGHHDSNDHPDSKVVIKNLKTELNREIAKQGIKAIAIFYDVRTTEPKTSQKTDAIAAFVEHKIGRSSFTFYYPYKLTNSKELTFSESFGGATEKEMFVK